jgi:hypothetical protein
MEQHGTEGIVAAHAERELSYGEKAVGLDFNPSGDPAVYQIKKHFADVIDALNMARIHGGPIAAERARIAIEHAITAQMWAIKTITTKE